MLLGASYSSAQFKLSAELRPRTEYSHGYAQPAADGQDASLFTSQRTRLNFSYSNQEKVKVGIVLQDVRVWGNQPQMVMNQDYATSIHEAWGEFSLGGNFTLKAGRQELVYDDHRIFGNVGWTQQARSHDLALFKYSGNFELHLGVAHHENTERTNNYYLGPDAYKNMQFLWFHKVVDNFKYSILLLNNGTPSTTFVNSTITNQETRYGQTLGTRMELDRNNWLLAGNLYFQFGQSPYGGNISAFEFALEAGKTFEGGEKLGVRYELLSGSESGSSGNSSFLPLYGTNHKFNGFMDYFYVGNHQKSVGLSDLQLSGSVKTGKATLSADLHLFNSHKEVAGDGKYLGTELDLGLALPINNTVKFAAGYSQMFASDRLALLKNVAEKGSFHNWAWVMLTFSPQFL